MALLDYLPQTWRKSEEESVRGSTDSRQVSIFIISIFLTIFHRFVLTARHCVSWDSTGKVVDGRMVELWLGSHGKEGQDGLKVPVRRILIRPDYQAPTCAR